MSSQKIEVALLVVGDSRTGKTSLIKRFIDSTFSEITSPTTKPMFYADEEIWDSPSQELMQIDSHMAGMDAICIVLTHTDTHTSTSIEFKKYYDRAKAQAPNALIYVIFNKNDEDNYLTASQQRGLKNAISNLVNRDDDDTCNRIFFCSAKTGENVDYAFCTMIDTVKRAKRAILNDNQSVDKLVKSRTNNGHRPLAQSSTLLKFGNPNPTSLKDDESFVSKHKNWIIVNIVLAIVIGITVSALIASGFGIPALIVGGVSVALLLAGDGIYIYAPTYPGANSSDNSLEDLPKTGNSDEEPSGFESDSENTKEKKIAPQPIFDKSHKLQIKTNTDEGMAFITVNPNDTIADLKIILEGLTGTPVEAQQILLDEKEPIDDNVQVSRYFNNLATLSLTIDPSVKTGKKLVPITVQTLDRSFIKVHANLGETVERVKQKYAGITGIPVAEQRLISPAAGEMQNPSFLSSHPLENNGYKINMVHILPKKDVTEERPEPATQSSTCFPLKF